MDQVDKYTYAVGQCAYCKKQGKVLTVTITFSVYENPQYIRDEHVSSKPICIPCLNIAKAE